jgi:mono/diheme cytochrome c family protein
MITMRISWRAGLAATGFVFVAAVSTLPAAPGQTPTLAQDSITGRDSYRAYCSSCHGAAGKGDGPTAAVLRAKPTDLSTLARRNGDLFSRSQVVEVITGTGRQTAAHGAPEMPLWGPIFRAFDTSDARVRQRIDNIVTHIETLQEPSTGLGARLFATHCATCHGATARGNGPLAASLRRAPPDLTKFTTSNGGIFPSERVNRIIDGRDVPSHGDREMPVWGNAFRSTGEGVSQAEAKARIDAIVRYLESIQERAAE